MKNYKYNIGERVVIKGQKRTIVKRYLDYGIQGGVEINMTYDPPKKYYQLDEKVKIGNYNFSTIEESEIEHVVR